MANRVASALDGTAVRFCIRQIRQAIVCEGLYVTRFQFVDHEDGSCNSKWESVRLRGPVRERYGVHQPTKHALCMRFSFLH